MRDFAGGPMVMYLPANRGNMGSIPGPGRSQMPWTNQVCVLELVEHMRPRACGLQLR